MKKLVISPHIDDEVLACGGILDKDTFIVECGVDENRNVPGWGIVTRHSRLEEIEKVCELSGAKYICLNHKVNFYDLHELIGDIEKIIEEQKPEEIYVPYNFSYNQDHREVYYACMVALRPHDVNHFVKKVFLYEQPHVFLWPVDNEFKPNYFVKLDIERKIKLYEEGLPSQVREFRSSETLRSLAQLRGKQSGYKFAEAYQIVRYIK